MKQLFDRLKNGIIKENPIFVQVLAMCPTLAVTTSAENAIGMGLATTFVLICSNIVVSMLRKFIPDKIRIPAFIVIIASFVTIVEFMMQAYLRPLYDSLGIFIPLIVVNCVILGRAEAFASKNKVVPSIFDGLGMGLGFTFSLTILGVIREIIGNGTIFGIGIMPEAYEPAVIMILAPGAFLTLGILMTIMNAVRIKKSKGGKVDLIKYDCGSCSACGGCSKVSK